MKGFEKAREFLTGEEASVSMPAKLVVSILAMAAVGSLAYYTYSEGKSTVTDVQGKTDAFVANISGP